MTDEAPSIEGTEETAVVESQLPPKSDPAVRRITAWLSERFSEDGWRGVNEVVLAASAHTTGRPDRGAEIHSFNASGSGSFLVRDAQALARSIVSMADNYMTGGSQRFIVRAQMKSGRSSSMAFTLESDDEAISEEPNARGALELALRHIEQKEQTLQAMTKYMMQSANDTHLVLHKQLELATERNISLEKGRIEHFDEREKLLSQDAERSLQATKLLGEEKRKDEMFEKLMTLFPVAVNKIAGKQLIGGSSPRDQMLQHLARRLQEDPDLMGRIAQTLPPDLVILVLEILKSAMPQEPQPNGIHSEKST